MADQTKATPRPWKVDPCVDADGHETIRRDDGTEHGNTLEQPIATVYYPKDADLIVQAVNSHDKLVGALRGLVESYRIPDGPTHIYEDMARRYNTALDVLEEATR